MRTGGPLPRRRWPCMAALLRHMATTHNASRTPPTVAAWPRTAASPPTPHGRTVPRRPRTVVPLLARGLTRRRQPEAVEPMSAVELAHRACVRRLRSASRRRPPVACSRLRRSHATEPLSDLAQLPRRLAPHGHAAAARFARSPSRACPTTATAVHCASRRRCLSAQGQGISSQGQGKPNPTPVQPFCSA